VAYAGKGLYRLDERRLYTRIEIKAVDAAQRMITGHAAAFSNTDRTGDAIQPGAFDRTLKETGGDVLVFVGHDSSKLPVGEPVEITSDAKGLFTQTRIYQTADGDALLEVAKQRLKSGRTLGMSIGYRTVKQRYQGNVRQLLDVDLVEYSFLASPALAANPEATVVGMKRRRATKTNAEESYERLMQQLEERDIPYTLDGNGVPSLDEPEEEAKAHALESKPYRIERRDDEYCVIGPSGKTLGCHPTRAEAQAQQRALYANEGKEDDRLMDTKAEWSTAYINNLPDSAFAYIEPGGTKDDEGKTAPRSLRHFPHHDADGKVDLAHLRNALARAPQSDFGSKAMAHLERHAKAEGVGDRNDGGKTDDAHEPEWAEGMAPALLLAALRLFDLAEKQAAQCKAMMALRMDTKHNGRANQDIREEVKDVITALSHLVDMAEAIEQGEDGKARVDAYRQRLALMELQEVA
jgi:HK97 family phage prohead protease